VETLRLKLLNMSSQIRWLAGKEEESATRSTKLNAAKHKGVAEGLLLAKSMMLDVISEDRRDEERMKSRGATKDLEEGTAGNVSGSPVAGERAAVD